MRKSKFTEEKMVRILREADATSIAEAAKKHGISDQTIYTWLKRFRGMEPEDVKRLKTVRIVGMKPIASNVTYVTQQGFCEIRLIRSLVERFYTQSWVGPRERHAARA